MKISVAVALVATLFGSQMQTARADEPPLFDINKSCKVDLQAYQGGGSPRGCLADEQSAKATLVAQWRQFGQGSRMRCTQMVSDGAGPPSYVELLTCLQMAKDVKGLPKD